MGEAQQLHATFLSAINDLRSMHEKQVSWHNHTASYSYSCVFFRCQNAWNWKNSVAKRKNSIGQELLL